MFPHCKPGVAVDVIFGYSPLSELFHTDTISSVFKHFSLMLGIVNMATMKSKVIPKITGNDFILYLKKKKVANAIVVPMMLVRNTHKIQGIMNRMHNNKSFFLFRRDSIMLKKICIWICSVCFVLFHTRILPEPNNLTME